MLKASIHKHQEETSSIILKNQYLTIVDKFLRNRPLSSREVIKEDDKAQQRSEALLLLLLEYYKMIMTLL